MGILHPSDGDLNLKTWVDRMDAERKERLLKIGYMKPGETEREARERHRREDLEKPYLKEPEILEKLRDGSLPLRDGIKAFQWLERREFMENNWMAPESERVHEMTDDGINALLDMIQADRVKFWENYKIEYLPDQADDPDVFEFDLSKAVATDADRDKFDRLVKFGVENHLIDGRMISGYRTEYRMSDDLKAWLDDEKQVVLAVRYNGEMRRVRTTLGSLRIEALSNAMLPHRYEIEEYYLDCVEEFCTLRGAYTIDFPFIARYHFHAPFWTWAFCGFNRNRINRCLDRIYNARRRAVLDDNWDPERRYGDRKHPRVPVNDDVLEEDLIRRDLSMAASIAERGSHCMVSVDNMFRFPTLPFDVITVDEVREQAELYRRHFVDKLEDKDLYVSLFPDYMRCWFDPGHMMLQTEYTVIQVYEREHRDEFEKAWKEKHGK